MFALKTVKKGEKSHKRNEKYSDGFTAKITCGFSSRLQLKTTIIIRRTLSTLKARLHIHILVVVLFYPSEVTGFTITFHIFCCSSILSASGLVPLEYRCMLSCEVHILWKRYMIETQIVINTNCSYSHGLQVYLPKLVSWIVENFAHQAQWFWSFFGVGCAAGSYLRTYI